MTYLSLIHWQGLSATLAVIVNLLTAFGSAKEWPRGGGLVFLLMFAILNTISMYYLAWLNGLLP